MYLCIWQWKDEDYLEEHWGCYGRHRQLGGGGVTQKSSRVYDHSLPHSRLTTGDVEGEWRTRAPIDPSKPLEPCSRLLPDCASDPLAGPAGRRRSMKWVIKSSSIAVT
ncbi:unnamed protein product [Spirodela intermedia]|uniref:Uncharacterized protein n=1 Tax=Spirodela intermedia TaxID=51605 RepID=A0A7I8JQ73_SPIIN|nr:unnamed protein product [Spirodela intermedia]CAA6672286.1 unnamed protein product [Spirodela intermedia]